MNHLSFFIPPHLSFLCILLFLCMPSAKNIMSVPKIHKVKYKHIHRVSHGKPTFSSNIFIFHCRPRSILCRSFHKRHPCLYCGFCFSEYSGIHCNNFFNHINCTVNCVSYLLGLLDMEHYRRIQISITDSGYYPMI